MKKLLFPVFSIVFFGTLATMSCQPDWSDRFDYKAEQDTIPPSISISVPVENQSYIYGNHVAIVGTVTDLESATNDIHNPGTFRKGELKTVTIEVDNLTNGTKLLNRTPAVSGMDGYSFNERVEIITGSGTTNCRLIIRATDGKDHTVRDTVNFQYN